MLNVVLENVLLASINPVTACDEVKKQSARGLLFSFKSSGSLLIQNLDRPSVSDDSVGWRRQRTALHEVEDGEDGLRMWRSRTADKGFGEEGANISYL
jgi:hypothetical protein